MRGKTPRWTPVNKNHSFLSLWQQDLTVACSSFEYPHKFPLNFTAELMRRSWKWHLEASTWHETLQCTVWPSGVFSEVIIAARMRQMIRCDGVQPPPTHAISPQHAHYPHHTRPHHHDHRGAGDQSEVGTGDIWPIGEQLSQRWQNIKRSPSWQIIARHKHRLWSCPTIFSWL